MTARLADKDLDRPRAGGKSSKPDPPREAPRGRSGGPQCDQEGLRGFKIRGSVRLGLQILLLAGGCWVEWAAPGSALTKRQGGRRGEGRELLVGVAAKFWRGLASSDGCCQCFIAHFSRVDTVCGQARFLSSSKTPMNSSYFNTEARPQASILRMATAHQNAKGFTGAWQGSARCFQWRGQWILRWSEPRQRRARALPARNIRIARRRGGSAPDLPSRQGWGQGRS